MPVKKVTKDDVNAKLIEMTEKLSNTAERFMSPGKAYEMPKPPEFDILQARNYTDKVLHIARELQGSPIHEALQILNGAIQLVSTQSANHGYFVPTLPTNP